MSRLTEDQDEPTSEQLAEALRRMPPEVLPYATRTQIAPYDWQATIRQVIFAAGIGFVAGGLVDWQGGSTAWKDNEVLWIGFGAAMIALSLPWPGKIGARRASKDH